MQEDDDAGRKICTLMNEEEFELATSNWTLKFLNKQRRYFKYLNNTYCFYLCTIAYTVQQESYPSR